MTEGGQPTLARASSRMEPVDALRGVAALMVVLFHLMFNSAQTEELRTSAPSLVVDVSSYLAHGVAIFFVISGFVITYSVRHLPMTWRGAGNFALRRQVRLDPPYFVVIFGIIVLSWVESRIPGLEARDFTPLQVFVNMVYLQDILSVPAVVAVAWTLCIEVQFYLVLVLIMMFLRRFGTSRRGTTQTALVRVAVLALMVISLSLPLLEISAGPWFIGYWWMFALGMIVAWVHLGEVSSRLGWIGVAGTTVWGLAVNLRSPEALGGHWAAVATGILLLALSTSGAMSMRMPRIWLRLGTLTYSLYLVHLTVIDVVMGALYKVTGSSIAGAWMSYVIGLVASLFAGSVLYEVVERRSLVWAQRLKPKAMAETRRGAPPPTEE